MNRKSQLLGAVIQALPDQQQRVYDWELVRCYKATALGNQLKAVLLVLRIMWFWIVGLLLSMAWLIDK